ncbi:cf28cfe7-65eb-4a74-94d3-4f1be8c16ef7 [Thermothielavioides terrestris]|uniref:Cf28cfe7-65eb-4a74-94d3-4f1be8c16ef7 n=1 Tax=Thermothielavioides terrestris TaxID=2587410 RepID=A0A446BVE2_9PEZI|nr:cf28cfe7-65eb-4a74-94d3-4f1be8c16ef7 [Thermothielavioides terrestris]
MANSDWNALFLYLTNLLL